MGKETGASPQVGTYLDEDHAPKSVMELEARMGLLASYLDGILFEVDRDGRYLAVWTGQTELLPFPPRMLCGRTIVEVVGPELGLSFVETIRRVHKTGEPEMLDYSLDVPRGRRNFRCQVRRTPAVNGTPAGTVTLLVRDITEETALKAKLVDAERLAALVAASVGHEIRQPLAFATTCVEVLAREVGAESTQRVREALDHVRDAVRRLASIAASVGVLAPDRPRERTTDVRRPIDAAVDLCASELQGHATVHVDVPETIARVGANEGELCQVLANLLLNAAHAAVPARASTAAPRIDVRASVEADGSTVLIEVNDNGAGIDPAYLERVFDPFFTTKEKGRGTGLGLFVSKRIVEEAGGSLAIASTLGVGTTVRLVLPIAESASSDADAPASSSERLRVLVIDDEPAFLRSLQLVLEDTHDVVVCGRSADALEIVRADPTRFDAILCDLSMPQIDGVAFYGHVEALDVADRFILMTAGAFTMRGEDFLRRSKCRRISKPFTMDTLHSLLALVGAKRG